MGKPMRWDSFIRHLSEKITWNEGVDSQNEDISQLLMEMYENRGEVIERFGHIIKDKDTFNEYSIHMEYPRPVMDKFVLYMDPQDRFRVRLHKFKTRPECRGVVATIHDHRWHFFSIILAGGYREEVYRVLSAEEDANKARIELVKEHMVRAGDINASVPLVPHLTVNESDVVPCFSLFIRGKSFYPYSRIFDKAKNTFKRSWGLKKELLVELETLETACQ